MADFLIKAKVDTNTLKKSIQAVTGKTYTIKVDAKSDNFKNLTTSINNIEASINRVEKSFATLNDSVNKFGNAINSAFARTNEKTKQTTNTTQTMNNEFVNINQTLNQSQTRIDEVNQSFSTYNTNVKNTSATLNSLNNGIINLDHSVTENTTNFKDQITNYNALGNSVQSIDNSTNRYNTTIDNSTRYIIRMSNATQQANRSASTLNNTFLGLIKRVSSYYLASLPMRTFTEAVDQAKEAVLEFDKALTEYKKVSDLSGESLDKYTAKLGQLGEAVAKTRTEMTQASTEFKKSGYDDNDSAMLAQIATMYQNIADEEISAGESASFIIAQLKAFYKEAEEGNETIVVSQHIIDAVNEVANNFAVSSGDLAENLGKVSATMAVTETSFEETLGMLTAITEVTRNASTASRGLKMISSRLTQTLDETSSTGQKLTKIYNDLGISLKDDVTGNIRSTYEILADLSGRWDTLSKDQQEYIALTSAGANQVQNFTALMENFTVAVGATDTALNSAGSAMKENEKYLDSIEGKTQQLKSAFQELVLGDGGLQAFVKQLLDIGTKLLKFANTDIGTTLLQLGVLIITLGTASATLSTFATSQIAVAFSSSSLGVALGMLGESLVALAFAGGTATDVMAGLELVLESLNINPVMLAISAVALLAFGTIKLGKHLKETADNLENNQEKLKDYKDSCEELERTYDDLTNQLDNVRKSIENLETIDSGQRTQEQERQLQLYRQQEASLERQLAIQEEQLRIEREKASVQAKKTLTTKVDYTYETDGGYYETESISRQEALAKELAQAQALQEEYNSLEEELAELAISQGTESAEYQNLSEQLDNVKEKLELKKETLLSESDAITEEVALLNLEDEANAKLAEGLNGVVDSVLTFFGVFDENKGTIGDISAEEEDFNDGIDEGISKLEELTKAFTDAQAKVNDLSSAYNTMASAIDEYNTSGAMSMETLNNLLALDSEYLSLLQFENGQLAFNSEGFLALANARIDEAEAIAVEKAEEELAQAQHEETNEVLGASANVSNNVVTAMQNAGQAALAGGEDALTSAKMWNEAYKAMLNDAGAVVQVNTNLNATQSKIWNSLKTTITTYESIRNSLGKYNGAVIKATNSTRSGSGATRQHTKDVDENTEALKANADALKEQVDALKEVVDAYKNTISYINGKVDDEIKKLEDLKDAEIDAIQEQIKNINELWDAEKARLNDEIDSLQNLRDERNAYWEEQINNLKNANNELESQLELEQLLINLETARSKKVKVFKEGQGFVYESDQEAVNKAQQQLDEYNRKKKLDEEIAQLEKARDDEKAIYDNQIKDLQDYIKSQEEEYNAQLNALEANKNAVGQKYDEQIAYYKKWKDEFKNAVNAYENEQNRLQALELTGIDFEKEGWQTRLGNLDSFVKQYNNYLKELNRLQEEYNNAQKAYEASKSSSSASIGTVGSSAPSTSGTTPQQQSSQQSYTVTNKATGQTITTVPGTNQKITNETTAKAIAESQVKEAQKQITSDFQKKGATSIPTSAINAMAQQKVTVGKKASGADLINKDQMALVGDSPNKELVIGSKLNGSLMRLRQGSGVVNAKSTHTLAGILNSLGSFSASNFGQGNGVLNNSVTNSKNSNISIGNISLPNVVNGQQFVDYLQNFSLDMTQLAY